jgi:hypothetical protein
MYGIDSIGVVNYLSCMGVAVRILTSQQARTIFVYGRYGTVHTGIPLQCCDTSCVVVMYVYVDLTSINKNRMYMYIPYTNYASICLYT